MPDGSPTGCQRPPPEGSQRIVAVCSRSSPRVANRARADPSASSSPLSRREPPQGRRRRPSRTQVGAASATPRFARRDSRPAIERLRLLRETAAAPAPPSASSVTFVPINTRYEHDRQQRATAAGRGPATPGHLAPPAPRRTGPGQLPKHRACAAASPSGRRGGRPGSCRTTCATPAPANAAGQRPSEAYAVRMLDALREDVAPAIRQHD